MTIVQSDAQLESSTMMRRVSVAAVVTGSSSQVREASSVCSAA